MACSSEAIHIGKHAQRAREATVMAVTMKYPDSMTGAKPPQATEHAMQSTSMQDCGLPSEIAAQPHMRTPARATLGKNMVD